MASSSLPSSRDGLEAADGALESAGPASGEERTGREEEEVSGGAGVRCEGRVSMRRRGWDLLPGMWWPFGGRRKRRGSNMK